MGGVLSPLKQVFKAQNRLFGVGCYLNPYPMADRGFWTSKSPLKGMFQPSSCWFDPKNSLSLILAILKCRF
jgi:hypothetical protein